MSPKTRSTPEMEKIQATLDTLVASNASLTGKLDKLDTLSKKIDNLSTSVKSIGDRLDRNEADLLGQSNKLDLQQAQIISLEKRLSDAIDEIDNLDNRSRRNNLRLLHLPEKSEAGYTMASYLAKILSDLLSIPLKELDIEAAHRIGALKEDQPRPRTVIFKLHHLQKKWSIMEAAKHKELRPRDHPGVRLHITADISVRRRKLRDQYWPLREQLHANNVKTRVRDPGSLSVWIDGEVHTFGDIEAAVTGLKTILPDLVIPKR